MNFLEPKAEYFFEVSYEVANKVGGIYEVLVSKASEMSRYYGSKYITIGFFCPNSSRYEFVLKDEGPLKPIFDEMLTLGIRCYYGEWHIAGRPRAILIDIKDYMQNGNSIKTWLWEVYKVDSLFSDSWFNEPVVWSYACGLLLEKIQKRLNCDIVAQFHEWMAGVALLYLSYKKSRIATVFTTHATILGRSIAGSGKPLVDMIEEGLAKKEMIDQKTAYDFGIQAKHQTEKACAENASVFTTVSETTALEAEYILGKKPDVVLPNGFNTDKFPPMEQLSYLHKTNKDKLLRVIRAYFAPYYSINLDDPRIIFISGRYEFHNKGLDLFIDSLADINNRMKNEKSTKDIFVFICIPSDARGDNITVLENISLYQEIEDYLEEIIPDLKISIINSLTIRNKPVTEAVSDIIGDKYIHQLNKFSDSFRARSGMMPPLCSAILNYPEESDAIISALRSKGLLNREEDRVKVIFYPRYLSATDRIIPLDYFSMIVGCTFCVFPSYYEPWGYTPVEAAANVAISITTDLAGVGQFMLKNINTKKNKGFRVLMRKGKPYESAIIDLSKMIYEIVNLTQDELIMQKHEAKQTSQILDWKNLSVYYIEAHNLAVEKSQRKA